MTGAMALGVAGVGADQRRVEVGLVEDLALPLLDGGRAGGQDQGLGLQRAPWRPARRSSCRRRRAGRSRPSRPGRRRRRGRRRRPPSGSRGPETAGPMQRLSRRPIGKRRPGGVAGQVLGRVADGDQRLLRARRGWRRRWRSWSRRAARPGSRERPAAAPALRAAAGRW